MVIAAQNIETPPRAMPVVALAACMAARIGRHARDVHPMEACGLLIGTASERDIRVHAVTPCSNAERAFPERRFEIAPADLFAAHRAARAADMTVVGHYHSHPTGMAVPSRADCDAIADPGAVWLIYAQKSGVLGAFLPNETLSGFYSLALTALAS